MRPAPSKTAADPYHAGPHTPAECQMYQAIRAIVPKGTWKTAEKIADWPHGKPSTNMLIEWNIEVDTGAVVPDPQIVRLMEQRMEAYHKHRSLNLQEARFRTEEAVHERIMKELPEMDVKFLPDLVKNLGLISNYGQKQLGLIKEQPQQTGNTFIGSMKVVTAGPRKIKAPKDIIEAEVREIGN